MVRNALAVLAAGSFVLASGAAAQKHPDFSGSWKINVEKSDPPPQRGGMGGGQQWAEMTVVITQTAEALTIEQKTGEQALARTFHLDGRESMNAGMRGQQMKSTSTWEGAALVTTGTTSMDTPQGAMEIKTTETRTLSEDGKTMTVVTVSRTPRGERTRKVVFERQ